MNSIKREAASHKKSNGSINNELAADSLLEVLYSQRDDPMQGSRPSFDDFGYELLPCDTSLDNSLGYDQNQKEVRKKKTKKPSKGRKNTKKHEQMNSSKSVEEPASSSLTITTVEKLNYFGHNKTAKEPQNIKSKKRSKVSTTTKKHEHKKLSKSIEVQTPNEDNIPIKVKASSQKPHHETVLRVDHRVAISHLIGEMRMQCEQAERNLFVAIRLQRQLKAVDAILAHEDLKDRHSFTYCKDTIDETMSLLSQLQASQRSDSQPS
jgi:hypothetical protein